MAKGDDIEEIFSSRLKSLREARGLSQAELGERANLATTTIYRFEAMERWAKPENVHALAKALGCKPSYFYSTDEAALPPDLVEHVAAAARACGLKVSR